jgi:hypothetical protein
MIQVTELQPYQSNLLKPDLESLDNIASIPKYKCFGVTPTANGLAIIDFPMCIAGPLDRRR